jgi:hypothetical protein
MTYRVVYVEVERRSRSSGIGRWFGAREPLRETRQRLAEDMERIGQEMLRRGLRLVTVTPMVCQEPPTIAATEAVWMHFATEPELSDGSQELTRQTMAVSPSRLA